MREALPDLATLAGGTAILLVYAALVESFLSQYHSPALYPFKIAFGLAELLVLGLFLSRAGRGGDGEVRGCVTLLCRKPCRSPCRKKRPVNLPSLQPPSGCSDEIKKARSS